MQEQSELVVRLGVAHRVACKLAPVLVVIGPLREVVSVREWRERALERQDVQAMARELELADDFRPEQAYHVRENGEAEARKHFLGHRGATDAFAALEHEHLAAAAREIGGAGEPVVAAADDDGVVALHARFRGGSKNGFFTTCAAARLRRCSTVISISSGAPGAAQRERRCASAMYFLRSGDQPPLVA